MRHEIDDELLDHYFSITEAAMEKARITIPERSHLHRIAEDFVDIARRYLDDANFFREKGDYVNAFGAIYYAHAWLDAAARLGLIDVGGDDQLFTLAE